MRKKGRFEKIALLFPLYKNFLWYSLEGTYISHSIKVVRYNVGKYSTRQENYLPEMFLLDKSKSKGEYDKFLHM